MCSIKVSPPQVPTNQLAFTKNNVLKRITTVYLSVLNFYTQTHDSGEQITIKILEKLAFH